MIQGWKKLLFVCVWACVNFFSSLNSYSLLIAMLWVLLTFCMGFHVVCDLLSVGCMSFICFKNKPINQRLVTPYGGCQCSLAVDVLTGFLKRGYWMNFVKLFFGLTFPWGIVSFHLLFNIVDIEENNCILYREPWTSLWFLSNIRRQGQGLQRRAIWACLCWIHVFRQKEQSGLLFSSVCFDCCC